MVYCPLLRERVFRALTEDDLCRENALVDQR